MALAAFAVVVVVVLVIADFFTTSEPGHDDGMVDLRRYR